MSRPPAPPQTRRGWRPAGSTVFIVLGVLAYLLLRQLPPDNSLSRVRAAGVLTACVPPGLPPFISSDGSAASGSEARLIEGILPSLVLQEVWMRLAEQNVHERDLIPPLAYEVLNPDPERARIAYQALPLGKVIEMILRPMQQAGQLRSDLSLSRMSNLIADTYLMIALRWSAYGGGRSLQEEMRLTLSFLMEGVLRR